jgi:hypothetical protein
MHLAGPPLKYKHPGNNDELLCIAPLAPFHDKVVTLHPQRTYMKFADRPREERAAIDAWIRIMQMARENGCMRISDDFKAERQKNISESSGDIAKMVSFYNAYQQGKHTVSYTEYFQVTNPAEYAAILNSEESLN